MQIHSVWLVVIEGTSVVKGLNNSEAYQNTELTNN